MATFCYPLHVQLILRSWEDASDASPSPYVSEKHPERFKGNDNLWPQIPDPQEGHDIFIALSR